MGNPDKCSDHKIIDKSNSCYGFDHDGKFCDVWHLIKQKYPHIKGMIDIASATLSCTVSMECKESKNDFRSFFLYIRTW